MGRLPFDWRELARELVGEILLDDPLLPSPLAARLAWGDPVLGEMTPDSLRRLALLAVNGSRPLGERHWLDALERAFGDVAATLEAARRDSDARPAVARAVKAAAANLREGRDAFKHEAFFEEDLQLLFEGASACVRGSQGARRRPALCKSLPPLGGPQIGEQLPCAVSPGFSGGCPGGFPGPSAAWPQRTAARPLRSPSQKLGCGPGRLACRAWWRDWPARPRTAWRGMFGLGAAAATPDDLLALPDRRDVVRRLCLETLRVALSPACPDAPSWYSARVLPLASALPLESQTAHLQGLSEAGALDLSSAAQ